MSKGPAARPTFAQRSFGALPLLIPSLAGLAYLALFAAPQSYILINAGALAVGLGWSIFGWTPKSWHMERGGSVALFLLLALTLRAEPEVEGITRWFAFGGFSLHAGLVLIPLIAVLSAKDEDLGAYVLLMALAITVFQPDAASALALTGAAFGMALTNHDRRAGAVGGIGLFAVAWASLTPNLAPEPFVERVIQDVWVEAPFLAILLTASLIASIALILRNQNAAQATKFALAGTFIGFTVAAILGDYPTPLIGYGASSIIGLSLALPAIRNQETSP